MHFQMPPHDHEKLVYVPIGAILDVVLDLRKESETYMKHFSVELTDNNYKSIFIPKGCAHGFKALEDNTITVYNVATEYNANADMGIKYDSFGYNWQLEAPILSNRDIDFLTFKEYMINNPF